MSRLLNRREIPVCKKCGAHGTGVEFQIMSSYGFGTYCVPCEVLVKAAEEGR